MQRATVARTPARARAAPHRETPARPERVRRWLVALLLLASLLAAAYFLWLRHSSLVEVEQTRVTGLTTSDAKEIRAALGEAALGMSTLAVDTKRLERAVASYPAVAGVEADADLPHGLTIEVIERRPVAVVEGAGGEAVPVAADGTLLPEIEPDERLAELVGAQASAGDPRLEGRTGSAALAAVAAAPEALRERVESIERDEYGDLVATLEQGPLILLGDEQRLETKWAAASAAIADGGAAEASYLDVSLPERPATG